MRIKLEAFYQNIKGQKVEAGEHDASNLPSGLAQYLVRTGHAVIVNDVPGTPAGNALREQNEPVGEVPQETTQESSLHDALVAEYEELTGSPPAWNIKTETLQARIADLKAEK